MDPYRNDYAEVCVYCHTPHGANTNVGAPLWNRAIPSTTYTVYSSNSLTQSISQPGAASLVCLSCHDGQQAVDAIMNMPGSGRYSSTPNTAFLNTWSNPSGSLVVAGRTTKYYDENSNGRMDKGEIRLYDSGSGPSVECGSCHDPHGVATSGSLFNATFLRKPNAASAVCLTCHSK